MIGSIRTSIKKEEQEQKRYPPLQFFPRQCDSYQTSEVGLPSKGDDLYLGSSRQRLFSEISGVSPLFAGVVVHLRCHRPWRREHPSSSVVLGLCCAALLCFAVGNAIVVSGEDATLVTTMIHQPDPSVAVGNSSQNDEDAKNPLRYNAMILEALSALKNTKSDLNIIVNFIEEPPWVEAIWKKSKDNAAKKKAWIAKDVLPFNFLMPMRIIRMQFLESEAGSNNGVRRCKHHGFKGDFRFEFSAIEVKTLVQYQLSMVVIVFNNGGVYGGDRRIPKEMNRPHKDDLVPTFFVSKADYHALIEVFGEKNYLIETLDELKSALYC
ncbi:2-hydroxyacyl-CoA lyase [Arachis hypogaea]|nr:2-hydroxyacyl-CoA lyase [Arachis hypogaea]